MVTSTGLGLTLVPLALQRTGSDQDLARQGTCSGTRTRSTAVRRRTETLPGSRLAARRADRPPLPSSRSLTALLKTPFAPTADPAVPADPSRGRRSRDRPSLDPPSSDQGRRRSRQPRLPTPTDCS